MLLIQILILLFVALAVAAVLIRYKEKRLSFWQTAAWLTFWLLAAIVAVIPQTSVTAAKLLGVTRGSDLVIYLSLIILFYFLFKTQVKLNEIEKKITKIVRHKALKKPDDSDDF